MYCQKQRKCYEEWCQVWWNGMGHYLLDGHNPQSYDAVVRQFKGLCFGNMDPECWKTMLTFVKAGRAFKHKEISLRPRLRVWQHTLSVNPILTTLDNI